MDKFQKVLEMFSRDFSRRPILTKTTVARIRSGEGIEDDQFDRIFPPYYHMRSSIHWSSLEVARTIASWIAPYRNMKFIDIGCGVGKLCILLRILTDHEIFGIEQRNHLVAIANKIIKTNKLQKILIDEMNILDLNWSDYDIYYLYNPFQEHISQSGVCILEKDIELDEQLYTRYTSAVFKQLVLAAPGKILITFHGYGGKVPKGWRLLASRCIENGYLSMWIKEAL